MKGSEHFEVLKGTCLAPQRRKQYPVSDQSPDSLSFFEMEEVHVAAKVAGNYQFKMIGKCTAIQRAITGEGGEHLSFAKSLRRHHMDFFPLDVSTSVLDGRLIRRPAKDVRRKCEP